MRFLLSLQKLEWFKIILFLTISMGEIIYLDNYFIHTNNYIWDIKVKMLE